MKSIKEKAEEYSSGYMNLDRQQVAKQALEYGANYVLNVLEEFMKHNLVHSSNIKRLIEQLKN